MNPQAIEAAMGLADAAVVEKPRPEKFRVMSIEMTDEEHRYIKAACSAAGVTMRAITLALFRREGLLPK